MTADLRPRPTLGTPARWTFPAPTELVLENGLRVLAVHLPGKRVATATLVLDLPVDTDPTGREGLAVLAARCLSKGTSAQDAEEFSSALERQGATFSSGAGYDGLTASVEAPVSRLGAALLLLAEAVLSPQFAADEADRVLKQRLAEIPQERSGPASRAALEFNALLYTSGSRQSLPSSGTAESVSALTPSDLAEGYRRRASPATSVLLLAGDLSEADVESLVQQAFGAWRGPAEPWTAVANVVAGAGRLVVVDRPGSVQTQLLLGHPAVGRTSPSWPAASLATYALGGTLTSRIDAVLREEKGYTYGIRASLSPSRLTGTLSISGSVDTESTGPALQDLMTVLDTALSDGLREEELVAARDFLVGVSPMRWETPGQIVGSLVSLVANDLPSTWIDTNLDGMRQASLDSLNAALGEVLRPRELLAVAVGEASAIVPHLEALGFGPAQVVPA